MIVTIHPAGREERAVLDNLMQLYSYDFSEIMDLDVGSDGRFAGKPLDAYWTDDGCHALFLHVDGRRAGFALLHEHSRLTGASGIFDMAEFFVLRKHRRRGVGRHAAFAIFDQFSGDWEIRQRPANVIATTFWRRTIGDYTGGNYKELYWDDRAWTGPAQFFSSPRRAASS
jgi:predicted acetyltransferase